ncbi:MAG: RNA polymerase sigma factor [Acidobacteria bacterium]|nr:RNA polymerase sigma factor [Acidobacteriota bacterium]
MTGQAIAMPAAITQHDDPAARLGILFDVHHQRLFRLARRLSRQGEDAHDLVQETFLRAARSPYSIPEGHSREEAWLVRILINICRDRWRSAAVHARAVADGRLDGREPGNPESALLARALVHTALDRLAPRRRAILVLYELEGVPVKRIASLLGMAAVTVRWHLSVGRREMAKIIGSGRPR